MKIVKAEQLPILNNPHGIDARKLFDNDYIEVMHLTLKPGEVLIKHPNPVDVIFFVLEGSGILELNDEKEEINAGSLIESPANAPRGWTNNGNIPLKILVIKTPKPTREQNKEAIQNILKSK